MSFDRCSKKISIILAILGGSLFGTASIFIRFLPGMDALSIGFYRMLFASIILLIVNTTFFGLKPLDILRKPWVSCFLGMILGLHFAFFISAVKHTTVMNASVLVNTTPMIAAILGYLFFRYKPSKLSIIGLLACSIGILMIFMATTIFMIVNLRGDLEALAAAFLWALYLNFGKSLLANAQPLPMLPMIYLFASLLMFTTSLSVGSFSLPDLHQLSWLLMLALLPTVLGHTLHFLSLRGLKPFQSATAALLEPIVASSLSAILFSEIPHPIFILGAVVTLSGVMLVLRG